MTVTSFARSVAWICDRNFVTALETLPTNALWALISSACVSNPPSDTDQTFVGVPAAMSFATTSNCCESEVSDPKLPPIADGKSSGIGAGFARTG